MYLSLLKYFKRGGGQLKYIESYEYCYNINGR